MARTGKWSFLKYRPECTFIYTTACFMEQSGGTYIYLGSQAIELRVWQDYGTLLVMQHRHKNRNKIVKTSSIHSATNISKRNQYYHRAKVQPVPLSFKRKQISMKNSITKTGIDHHRAWHRIFLSFELHELPEKLYIADMTQFQICELGKKFLDNYNIY